MIRLLPCVAAVLVLSACGPHVNYPSLARRDAERITGTAPEPGALPPPPVSVPLPPPNAATTSKLDQLVQQARATHNRFGQQQARTEQAVGRASGTAMGSESWSVASISLAQLESVNSETTATLAVLDDIHREDALAHYNTQSGDAANIAAALEQVQAWTGEQERVLGNLRGKLGT